MKLYYKLGILILICVFCYLLGNWIPFASLNPSIKPEKINTSEYYQIIISSISAVVTFLAVIIALFKEDIRKNWEYSRIEVVMSDEVFFEILNSSIGSSTDVATKPLEAVKYVCKIDVLNSGSISATGLEIYLESLSFTGQDYPTPQIIETENRIIVLNGINDTDFNLSPEGKKTIGILELTSPSQQSSPEGSSNDIPPRLNIAGIVSSPDFKKGRWVGNFAIYSTNAKPVRFKLEVDWNGKWQKRASEMKNNLKIDLKK